MMTDYDAITAIVRQELPEASSEDVEDLCLYDWPEGQDHLDWLNTASPTEIAHWVVAGLRDVFAERRQEQREWAEHEARVKEAN